MTALVAGWRKAEKEGRFASGVSFRIPIRCATKLAVAVDQPFRGAVGGACVGRQGGNSYAEGRRQPPGPRWRLGRDPPAFAAAIAKVVEREETAERDRSRAVHIKEEKLRRRPSARS